MKQTYLTFTILVVSTILYGQASSELNNFIQEQNSEGQKKYHAIILVDPVGFITLGPSVQLEPIFGKHISLNSGIRFQNLGLVSTSLFGSMDLSYGLQFSLKIFPKPRNRADGFFVGPGFSYGRDNYKTGRSYNFRALGATLGYRWIFKRGFTLEIADLVGIVQSREVDMPGETDWVTDMFVFYMLSVGLGIAL